MCKQCQRRSVGYQMLHPFQEKKKCLSPQHLPPGIFEDHLNLGTIPEKRNGCRVNQVYTRKRHNSAASPQQKACHSIFLAEKNDASVLDSIGEARGNLPGFRQRSASESHGNRPLFKFRERSESNSSSSSSGSEKKHVGMPST